MTRLTKEDNVDPWRCHCPNISEISLRACVDDMRSCATVILSDGTEKTEGNRPDRSYVNMSFPFSRNAVSFPRCFYQRAHTTGLWTSVHFDGIFLRRKNCLPSAPWEPNRVPVPRRSLGPTRWSDPDAAGVWKGTAEECGGFTVALIDRGQDEVGSHISWLWSPSLSFISYALTLPHLSCLLSGCLLMPVFYVLCWDGVELCGEQTALRFKSGSLPHLCWAFNELFYSPRLNRNRNL